jgi:cytochrome c oxidase subunit III
MESHSQVPKHLKYQPKEGFRMNPKKFNLWLLMLASIMLFMAFTSAYIVHRSDSLPNGQWLQFDLPVQFTWSLITVIISSVLIQLAYRAASKDEIPQNRIMLLGTLALAIVFCTMQYQGWQLMTRNGLPLVPAEDSIGGVSASFVYVITVFHFLHVLGGIFLLGLTFMRSLRFRVHKKNMLLMGITNTYWHFVGLLWIYLFLFLYFAR